MEIISGRGRNRTYQGQDYCPPHGFEGRDRHQTTSTSSKNIKTTESEGKQDFILSELFEMKFNH